jgi:hypothetical protein
VPVLLLLLLAAVWLLVLCYAATAKTWVRRMFAWVTWMVPATGIGDAVNITIDPPPSQAVVCSHAPLIHHRQV